MIAAIAKTISCADGHGEVDEVDAPDEQAGEDDAEDDPEHGPDQRRDHALVADHPADLAPGHPDRAQHPQLARPLEDGQHERVDDAEEADDDGEREQDVEDVEDVVEEADLVVLELARASATSRSGSRRAPLERLACSRR